MKRNIFIKCSPLQVGNKKKIYMLKENETVMTWQRNRNFKEFATNVPGRLFTCALKRKRELSI